MEPIGPEVYLAIAAGAKGVVTNYKDKRTYKKNEKLRKLASQSTSTGWTDGSSFSSNRSLEELLDTHGLQLSTDGYVQWSMSSPEHPRNWPKWRKTYDLLMVAFFFFFTSAISAAGTPASSFALKDFHVSKEIGLLAFTTIHLVGQALGGLLFLPNLEAFGRKKLYIVSAFFYSIFCIPVAATPNIAAVFVGRFITGVLSVVPSVVVSDSIEDLFNAEGRIWGFFVWSLVTNIGLVLGPIFAAYVAASLSWRWVFYLASIIVAGNGILMFFVRESHPSLLLERKVSTLQRIRQDLNLRTDDRKRVPDTQTFIEMAVLRPFRFFFTEPIVFLTSIMSAIAFGLIYLLAEALPIVYADFGFSQQKSMLMFLFVAIGLLLSTLTRFYDRHIACKRQRSNLSLCPEHKLFGFMVGAPLLAISLWWFAWTIPPKVGGVAWPASAISLILLGYAVNEFDTVLARYLADSYTSYAVSAFASLAFARSILSGVFPLFTPKLCGSFGNNVATSVLAAIATVFCLAPPLLLKYGRRLRGTSRFARESLGRVEIEGWEKRVEEKRERKRVERERLRDMNEHALAAGIDTGGMAVVPYF